MLKYPVPGVYLRTDLGQFLRNDYHNYFWLELSQISFFAWFPDEDREIHETTVMPITISLSVLHHHFFLTPWCTDWSTSRMLSIVSASSTHYRVKILVLILALCVYSNSIRERTWLYREAVLHPSKSPWNHLFHYGDPSSFMLMTGLTREAFNTLHDLLKPPGHPDLPKRKGCKWSLSSEGQLGLFLFYIGSTMNYNVCVWFFVSLQIPVRVCWGICWSW